MKTYSVTLTDDHIKILEKLREGLHVLALQGKIVDEIVLLAAAAGSIGGIIEQAQKKPEAAGAEPTVTNLDV